MNLRHRRSAPTAIAPLVPAAPLTLDGDPNDPQIPPATALPDLLAPAGWAPKPFGVDLGNGQWAASLIVEAYPAMAHTGFLNRLLRASVPRRLSFTLTPLNTANVMSRLGRDMEQHMATLRIAQKQGKPYDPYVQQAYDEAVRLRDAIAANTLKMFSLSFVATIFADSPEQLRDHVRRFTEEAAGSMWILRPTWLEHDDAWRTTLPLAEARVERPRPLDSDSLACAFPFTWNEHIEPGGLYLGTNLLTGGPVFVHLFDKRRYPAAHLAFLAKTRSGKSQTAKTLLLQALLDPTVDACVIDPSAPVDYGVIGQRLGRFMQIKQGTPERDRWNLCAIEYPLNMGKLDAEDRRLLTQKIGFLLTAIDLMAQAQPGQPGLDPEMRARVETALREVYGQYGITDDPLTLIRPDTLSLDRPVMKDMPRFRQMVAHFATIPALQRLATILTPYCAPHGTLDLFDGDQSPKALTSRFAVFNVHGLLQSSNTQLQSLAYVVLGELIQQRMLATGRRTIVVIDEAHVLFSTEETALWVARLFRMAAKLDSAIWLITQSVTDLIGDGVTPTPGAVQARVCLSNTYLHWLGRADSEVEMKMLAKQFDLTGSELGWIKGAAQGDGLWVSSQFHLLTHQDVPDSLRSLVSSTDEEQAALRTTAPDPLGGRIPLPAQQPA